MTTPLEYPLYTIGDWVGNATDDHGVDWIVTREDGWSSSSPVRTHREDRAGRDGSYQGRNRLGARIITLEGTAIAPNRLAMLAAKDRLAAVGMDSDVNIGPHLLTVTESHMERVAWVRREDVSRASDKGPTAFQFGLIVTAADPLRYSAISHTVRAELPASAGPTGRSYPRTYPLRTWLPRRRRPSSPPTLATTRPRRSSCSPARSPTPQSSTSKPVAPSASTLSSREDETLEVDLDHRTVLVNGTAGRRNTLVTGSAWFALYPGANTLRYRGEQTYPPGGGVPVAAMDVTYRDAWS